MFLLNLNCFNSSPSLSIHSKERFFQDVEGKRAPSDSIAFSLSLFLFLCLHYLCVLLSSFESVYFYALFCLTCFCLSSFSLSFFFFHIKIKKIEKS